MHITIQLFVHEHKGYLALWLNDVNLLKFKFLDVQDPYDTWKTMLQLKTLVPKINVGILKITSLIFAHLTHCKPSKLG